VIQNSHRSSKPYLCDYRDPRDHSIHPRPFPHPEIAVPPQPRRSRMRRCHRRQSSLRRDARRSGIHPHHRSPDGPPLHLANQSLSTGSDDTRPGSAAVDSVPPTGATPTDPLHRRNPDDPPPLTASDGVNGVGSTKRPRGEQLHGGLSWFRYCSAIVFR
jgi:hypothetical protein